MASRSPTQRTLEHYSKQGYECGIVERFIPRPDLPGGGFRLDFKGIIDLIAFNEEETLGVQSCGNSHAEHYTKLTVTKRDESIKWLKGHDVNKRKLILISWRKVKAKPGGKAMVWKPRIEEITFETLEEEAA